MSPAAAARGAPPAREDWDGAAGPGGAGRPRTLGGFLRVLELHADEAARFANAFDRLRGGDLQAVIVHEAYGAAELASIVERLERHDPPFLRTEFPEAFRSSFYGENLNLAPPDLTDYFAESPRFHAQLEALFPAGRGLVARVGGLLAALDHGRPFLAPPGHESAGAGARYLFTTLRVHREGGYIPPHFDNEYALRPSYRHLRTLVEPHFQSFVLALTRADAGGALEIYDQRCAPADAVLLNDDRAASRPEPGAVPSVRFRLPPGALIVLDSGRYLHRVSPVEGPNVRWTACSFLARARGHDAVYCWG